MHQLTAEEVTFVITCKPEEICIEGHVLASEDEEENRQAEDYVVKELQKGNVWAWCTVTVTAEWEGLKSSTDLGCCSYGSEKEFKQGGYYKDMCNEALDDLNNKIAKIDAVLLKLREQFGD